jgi:branched-chain amino acid transport system substrate-binding protein
MRARRVTAALAMTAAAALTLAACGGGSSGGGGTTGASGGTGTYKLGVLYDATGPAAQPDAPKGVQAYVNYVNGTGGVNGAKLSMVSVDTGSSPAGALAAAQKLVQQDHVYAMVALSSFFYGAQPFLLQNHIPVVGLGFDGPEWNDPKQTNMFSYEVLDYNNVFSTIGEFFKSQGVTGCATIGYSDSPSATASAKGLGISCEKAGLKNSSIQLVKFNTTDVGPLALAIQKSGADGLYLPVEPSTGFAVASVLQQLGAHMKSIVFPIGYGGDLLSSPAGVKAAQGYTFFSAGAPTELNTPATQLQEKWLNTAGVQGDPTFGEQIGWLSSAIFAAGMKAVGANASQTDFIKGLRAVKGFTAGGLLAPPTDFSVYSPTQQCSYAVKLTGKKFVPLSDKPFCGTIVGTISGS